MKKSLKKYIGTHLKNIIGKRLKKKCVVIESDDWGSVRMPSHETRDRLIRQGLHMGSKEGIRYNNTDTLAGKEDFEALFSVLRSFTDSKGNHPVFTALSLVANPDFKKIEEHNFEEYFFEPFTTTLSRYNKADAFRYWKEGFEEGIFVPEFHGREHLNISTWLRSLQKKWPDTMTAFKEGLWGFQEKKLPPTFSYQAAFHLEHEDDVKIQQEVIRSGLKLFNQLHDHGASYFVAPNGYFNNSLEIDLFENGIKYIGAQKLQKEPLGQGRSKKNLHWLGKKNNLGQIYITRNAFFEPNAPGDNWIKSCLKEIEIAFKWCKPAVISTHRTNYIGSLILENRRNSLDQLSILLSEILRRWPDVEFMTSAELGDTIKAD